MTETRLTASDFLTSREPEPLVQSLRVGGPGSHTSRRVTTILALGVKVGARAKILSQGRTYVGQLTQVSRGTLTEHSVIALDGQRFPIMDIQRAEIITRRRR